MASLYGYSLSNVDLRLVGYFLSHGSDRNH